MLSVIIAVGIAYTYNTFSDKIYLFRATMLIGDDQAAPRSAAELFTTGERRAEKATNINDEIEKLRSFAMVRKMVDRVGMRVSYFEGDEIGKNEMFKSSPIQVILDSSNIQPINTPFFVTVLSETKFKLDVVGSRVEIFDYDKGEVVDAVSDFNDSKELSFGEDYKNDYCYIIVAPTEAKFDKALIGQRFHFILNNPDDVTREFRESLEVNPINRQSNIVELIARGTNHDKAKTLINELMNTFRVTDLEQKKKVGEQTLDFIQGKLAEASKKLGESESAEAYFRSGSDIRSDAMRTSIESSLTDLEAQKAQINSKLSQFEFMIEALKDEDLTPAEILSTAAYADNDPILKDYFDDLYDLSKEKADLEEKVRPGFPELKVLKIKLDQSRIQLMGFIGKKVDSEMITLTSIEDRIDEKNTTLSRAPSIKKRQNELARKSDFDKDIYQLLLQKEQEAQIGLVTTASGVNIIDEAEILGDSPVSPNTIFNIIVAFLIGIAFPYLIIVIKETLDDRIKNQEDLKSATQVPYLGMIMKGEKEEPLVFESPGNKSLTAESFRSLRVNIEHLKGYKDGVIGFTSTISGEGKTFCSANMAHTFALSGKKTVLICADLRKPRVDEYFDGLYEEGLSNYLLNECEIDETVQKSKIENLDIINAGPTPENPTVILDTKRMRELMDALKEKYDQIVIDTPPIGFVSEYFILKRYIDVSIYVVRANYTDRKHLQDVNELYKSEKLGNINMLLNDVRLPDTHNYYGNAYANGYYYYAD
ncbi:polysaccharide biosynthesis tyrosine autokinase [Flammeovirgaceae bacterium SG7u.111]|nr:polysaccharide biosynthesis tyrosine autokinase [Flammeovirgaceae bacterium SG7u.132]WPO35906.1 polysaccharide biosynthesis tyrosine autokinase [Flammeovirgaceae bacterium SG7u.111]